MILKTWIQRTLLSFFNPLIAEVKGIDNLPSKGGYILASNHCSHIDPFLIASTIFSVQGRMARFLGKKETLSSPFGRLIYWTFDVIPLDRQAGDRNAMAEAISALKRGEVIGIFPEGTRSLDGKPKKAKTGAVRIAHEASCPILPLFISNTFAFWPRYKKLPSFRQRRNITLTIGKPIHLESAKHMPARELRFVTSSLMSSILHLNKKKP